MPQPERVEIENSNPPRFIPQNILMMALEAEAVTIDCPCGCQITPDPNKSSVICMVCGLYHETK
ncbi:hypothetical protein COT97_05830 [Candidatus Falkowbacteria bacterium CG10_big_fil_rev_8_21_14_0_10_39_11]|uniref:Uncharacterized protein n=1 Tax=Candidatus Falkowbacteria bacterium CG10_big_fil_rev_8_21_14_0_10_39_11 TaxID=1974565 RepID=A0A2H0V3F1_9BACT|nr:MAG: hypothetical protein COT97_05830 [Candidatus Falkowbacteria bacterium CG10_big_fil_rev_8_21_14_0_10_39_11]